MKMPKKYKVFKIENIDGIVYLPFKFSNYSMNINVQLKMFTGNDVKFKVNIIGHLEAPLAEL